MRTIHRQELKPGMVYSSMLSGGRLFFVISWKWANNSSQIKLTRFVFTLSEEMIYPKFEMQYFTQELETTYPLYLRFNVC